MRPQVVSVTGVGNSAIVAFDGMAQIFNVGIGCEVTGTVNYTVYHTFDDIMNTPPSNLVWFPHDDANLVAVTANANDNYAFPCSGARVTINSGTGTVTTTFIQSGAPVR